MGMDLIKKALNVEVFGNSQVSLDSWADTESERAERISLYRAYAVGEHRANLTDEMKGLLRLGDDILGTFNDNYMDIIIQTMVDRLQVAAVEAGSDETNAVIAAMLSASRFDALQSDIHEAAIRDGDTYLLIEFDNDMAIPRLIQQSAYDGTNGMLVVHDNPGNSIPDVAIKVWQTAGQSRINVYYPDRIEKFISSEEGDELLPFGEPWPIPWLPGVVPVVHFRNRGASYGSYGVSEIAGAIPLQDVLNRTLYSMVMASELTAFQIRYAVGWQPPANITPGMWVTISGDAPLSKEQQIDIGVMEQGQIVPFIEQAKWITSEIGKITRTPSPEFMGGDNTSGEALKQREAGLLGKVSRFQVRAGNAWEDAVGLAFAIQAAFGTSSPPQYEQLSCRWHPAELRNDRELVETVLMIANKISKRELLRQVSPVFGWDEEQIAQILEERDSETGAALSQLSNSTPDYSNLKF